MGNLFFMKVGEAYAKSNSSELADGIWHFKHPEEEIDVADREYVSWRNSLPHFLECAHNAGLDELYVVFEMKTPISNKAIDVLLLGYSDKNEDRILMIELKQWSRISTQYANNPGKVYVPEARASRRHPLKQLNLYENNLKHHHSGIQNATKDGKSIAFGKIAYLHNFDDRRSLFTDKYSKWESLGHCIYGGGDKEKERLKNVLNKCFVNKSNDELLSILEDYEAVMGDEGLAGLRKAYSNEASLTMQSDQQQITDYIKNRLVIQKNNPHKEMIVISGGPGTGKTIVGIRFILEYVNIFNGGSNDNKVIFCLPKSQTVKAMFDAACAVDEEYEKEYCCYLQEIGSNQNLVVVDEAHRITKLEDSLDEVFNKGTNLLILLQDDHQLLRPGEQGTYEAFKEYAINKGIQFSPIDLEDQRLLTLIDEKRCDEKWLNGLTKLFYDESIHINAGIDCIKVFNKLSDLEKWKNEEAQVSRTKYIFPFCWQWGSRNNTVKDDIVIGRFKKKWNPEDTDEQVIWLNDNTDDRAACIYTSQGLDMDNVAFIWSDDLVWDEENSKWVGHIDELKDPAFRCKQDLATGLWHQVRWDRNLKRDVIITDGFTITQDDIDLLIKNTYYVMLSRPRKNVAIWFKNEVTKKHVLDVLGLRAEDYNN